MSNYQQIVVATGSDIGSPGPLPDFLVGLSDATLANLSAGLDPEQMANPHLAPYQGRGFLPVADPAPPAPRWISVYAFMQRFTAAERQAIEGSADKVIIDFMTLLREVDPSGPGLYLDDPNTQAAVNYMASSGVALIAADRPAQILA